MRAERRQELKTNELAEQIEQVKAFAREHRATIAIVIAGAVIVFGGATWYTNNLQTRRSEAWNRFRDVGKPVGVGAEPPDAATRIDHYTDIANEKTEPALTLAAWLAVGDVARNQVLNPPIAGTTESRDWRGIAERAYQKVLDDFPKKTPAVGAAMMALGALAEDVPDMETARKWYNRIIEDPRFENTPFVASAKFRLEHLEEWSLPVVFAPPIIGPIPPEENESFSSPDLSRLPPGLRQQLSGMSNTSIPVDGAEDGVTIDRLPQAPFPVNEIAPAGDSKEKEPADAGEQAGVSGADQSGAAKVKKDAKGASDSGSSSNTSDAGAGGGGGSR